MSKQDNSDNVDRIDVEPIDLTDASIIRGAVSTRFNAAYKRVKQGFVALFTLTCAAVIAGAPFVAAGILAISAVLLILAAYSAVRIAR